MKEKKIQEAMAYSQRAIQAIASLTQGSQELREAQQHLKSAITKMEHQAKKGLKRKEVAKTQAQQWWGTIETNVSIAKMSEQSVMKTLKELDKMLSIEQKKINELENNTKPKIDPTDTTPSQDSVFLD